MILQKYKVSDLKFCVVGLFAILDSSLLYVGLDE